MQRTKIEEDASARDVGAEGGSLLPPLAQPTLFSYRANDLVWARTGTRGNEPFWPGRMIDVLEAPEGVRRDCAPNSVCVQFYGPSQRKNTERDYCWANETQLAPFAANLTSLSMQSIPKRARPTAFKEALEEARALFATHGENVSALHPNLAAFDDAEDDPDAIDPDDPDAGGPTCSSCYVPLDKEGGVKGTGRCALCAKLHKEGQFCPACDKVWQWANCPAMVGCDAPGCEFWVHASCDARAKEVMDAPENEDIEYHCPRCVDKAERAKEIAVVKAVVATEKKARKKALKLAEKKEAAKKATAATAKKSKSPARGGGAAAMVKTEAEFDAVSDGDDDDAPAPAPAPAPPPRAIADDDQTRGVVKRGRGRPPLHGGGRGRGRPRLTHIKGIDLSNAVPLIQHKKAPGGVPRRPKSAWQLFGSDFFKEFRERNPPPSGQQTNFAELYKIQGQAWRDLPEAERKKYENLAKEEADKFRQMVASVTPPGQRPPVVGPGERPRKYVKKIDRKDYKPGSAGDDDGDGPIVLDEHGRQDMGGGISKDAKGKLYGPNGLPLTKQEIAAAEEGWKPRVDRRASHWSQHFDPKDIANRPDVAAVICNGVKADFLVREFRMRCNCSSCKGAAPTMSATEFEKHAGMGQAKKWKASIRMVEPVRMPIGRWLDGGVRRSRAAAGGDEDRGGGRGGGRGGSGRGRGRPRSESYISEDRKRLGYEIIRVQWSVDRCAVCDDDRDFDFDQLVTCEGCAISVHQSCYGIPEIPDDAVGWLCAACEHTGGVVSETPLCCLCPVEGGALKPTTKPGRWCHSACCQWIPETTVLDVDTMQPIDQIDTIQRERWELLCTVCKQRHGAKIQCDHPGCYLAYHPLCARASGLFMEARLGEDDGEDEDSPLMMVSYCHRHCLVDTERAALYSGEEGLSIGRNGLREPAKQDHTVKLTKGVKRKMEEKARKEALEADAKKLAAEDALDEPEDEFGAARCRVYAPQGHPRTEAGDEVIVAADNPSTRRALKHGIGLGRSPGGGGRSKRREREAWVQCENCNKWRRVPQSKAEEYTRADAGEWTCEVSTHPRINSCDVPQELPDDDIDARIAMGENCPFYDDEDLNPPETISSARGGKKDEDEDKDAPGLGAGGDSATDADSDADEEEPEPSSDDDLLVEGGHGHGTDDGMHGTHGSGPLGGNIPSGEWEDFVIDGDPHPADEIGALVDEHVMRDHVHESLVDLDDEPSTKRARTQPAEETVAEPRWEKTEKTEEADEETKETEDDASAPSAAVAVAVAAEKMVVKKEPPAPAPREPVEAPVDAKAESTPEPPPPPTTTTTERLAEKADDTSVWAVVAQQASASQPPSPFVGGGAMDVDAAAAEVKREVKMEDDELEREPLEAPPAAKEPPKPKPPLSNLPDVKVLCRNIEGVFRPRDNMIYCVCTRCERESKAAAAGEENRRLFEPNRWEAHSGMSQAKKWKTSIRVVDPKLQPQPPKAGEGGDSSEETEEVETFLGTWLDDHGIEIEIVPGRPPKKGGDDAKPKPIVRSGLQKPKGPRGKTALAGLAIDLDVDLTKGSEDFEEKARALVGLRVSINANAGPEGAQLNLGGAPNVPPNWVTGTIADVKSSRGGCRHRVAFDDGGDDWFTLNRVQVEWPGMDEEDWPDLSFLPETAIIPNAHRRGLGGFAAVLKLSRAKPAIVGKHAPPKPKPEGEDEDDAKEDPAKPRKRRRDAEAWTQCANEACRKWRRVPESVIARLEDERADAEENGEDPPPEWTCADNGDVKRASCDAPQEFDEEEIARRVALAASGDAPRSMYEDGNVCGDGEGGPGSDGEEDDGPDNGLIGALPDDLPDCVTVVCRHSAGDYHPRTGYIRCLCKPCFAAHQADENDKTSLMEPSRWEIHCGMGQAKKWKASMRVILENNKTMPAGKWLETFGIAVRRAPRAPRVWGAKRAKLQKMKNRGELENEENIYRRLKPMKVSKRLLLEGAIQGPPPRSGKRAFVELIPYVVRGSKLHSKGGNNTGGFALPGAGGVGGPNGSTDPTRAEGAALPESRRFTPEEWEAENAARLAAKTSGAVAVAAMEIAAAIVDEGKGVRERMEEAHDFLHERFTFGKSNIHGWGLIAKKPVKAGSMVIEFRGEIVKPHVADLREKAYDDANIDCYLLKADEKTVIDTTMRGNIARFTNHSCNPNMYTKIVSVDGSNHIIFFARVDVQPGEEMTYDYRFDAESGKVPCYCGAHNCRGFLC